MSKVENFKGKTFKEDPERARMAGRKSRKPTAELNKLTNISANQFKETIFKYMYSSMGDLKKLLKDPKTDMIDLMIIKLMIKAVESGDVTRLNFILDRTIGKVQDKVEISGFSHKTLIEQIKGDA